MGGSEHEPNVAPSPHKPWRRWLLRGVLAVPVVFAITAASLWWTQGRTVAKKLQAIRDRGQPTTPAELYAFYMAPPPDKDATQLWLTAGVNLAAAGRTELARQLPFMGEADDPPPPGQPWNELPLAEQFLNENALAMQMLHDAAQIGGAARYPTDPSQVLPDTQNMINTRQSARCLALEAMVRAHRGDAAGAAASLRTTLSLAGSLENEPILVSQIVRIAVCGIANWHLKELLPETNFSDDDLARLQSDLLAGDYHDGWRRAMLGERVFAIGIFDDPSALRMNYVMTLAARAVRNGDLVRYLSATEERFRALEQPWPDALQSTDQLTDDLARQIGPLNIITKQLGATDGMVAQAAARATAQCRVMALAIALERYRKANGKPPATLEELAPKYIKEVPVDPYTGNAFNCQVSDTGYVIFSLGGDKRPDLTDPETGALELLLFRWPPKPKPTPAVDAQDAAPTGEP